MNAILFYMGVCCNMSLYEYLEYRGFCGARERFYNDTVLQRECLQNPRKLFLGELCSTCLIRFEGFISNQPDTTLTYLKNTERIYIQISSRNINK